MGALSRHESANTSLPTRCWMFTRVRVSTPTRLRQQVCRKEIVMLKIVKAADPLTVERINLCLYSSPGTGKTSMGFTADKPILLDADEGSYRAGNRKDAVIVKQW